MKVLLRRRPTARIACPSSLDSGSNPNGDVWASNSIAGANVFLYTPNNVCTSANMTMTGQIYAGNDITGTGSFTPNPGLALPYGITSGSTTTSTTVSPTTTTTIGGTTSTTPVEHDNCTDHHEHDDRHGELERIGLERPVALGTGSTSAGLLGRAVLEFNSKAGAGTGATAVALGRAVAQSRKPRAEVCEFSAVPIEFSAAFV